QGDLAALFGSAPRASEILKRHRAMTKRMVHQLATAWRLPAEALIAPYKIKNAKKAGRRPGRQKATGRPEGRPWTRCVGLSALASWPQPRRERQDRHVRRTLAAWPCVKFVNAVGVQ